MVREIIESAHPGQGLSLSQVYRLIKDVKDGKDTTDMRGRNKPKTTRTPEFIESVKADMVPRGTTVNADCIVGALKQFFRRMRLKRPQMVEEGFILHWDNAPVHTACIIMDFLATKEMVEVLSHPPYSPDLAPVTSSYPPR